MGQGSVGSLKMPVTYTIWGRQRGDSDWTKIAESDDPNKWPGMSFEFQQRWPFRMMTVRVDGNLFSPKSSVAHKGH